MLAPKLQSKRARTRTWPCGNLQRSYPRKPKKRMYAVTTTPHRTQRALAPTFAQEGTTNYSPVYALNLFRFCAGAGRWRRREPKRRQGAWVGEGRQVAAKATLLRQHPRHHVIVGLAGGPRRRHSSLHAQHNTRHAAAGRAVQGSGSGASDTCKRLHADSAGAGAVGAATKSGSRGGNRISSGSRRSSKRQPHQQQQAQLAHRGRQGSRQQGESSRARVRDTHCWRSCTARWEAVTVCIAKRRRRRPGRPPRRRHRPGLCTRHTHAGKWQRPHAHRQAAREGRRYAHTGQFHPRSRTIGFRGLIALHIRSRHAGRHHDADHAAGATLLLH